MAQVAILGAGSSLSRRIIPILLNQDPGVFERVTLVARGGEARLRESGILSDTLISTARPRLECADIDVFDESSMRATLFGHHAVLSLLTPPQNDPDYFKNHTRLMSHAIRSCASVEGLERMCILGGAGVLSLPWKKFTPHEDFTRDQTLMDHPLSLFFQKLFPVYAQYSVAHLENLRLLAKHFPDERHSMIAPGFLIDVDSDAHHPELPRIMVETTDAPLHGFMGLATTYREVAPVCVDALAGKYAGKIVGVATQPLSLQATRILSGTRTHVLPLWNIRQPR